MLKLVNTRTAMSGNELSINSATGNRLIGRSLSFLLLAFFLASAGAATANQLRMTIRLEHDDYEGAEPRDAVATAVAVSNDGKQIAAAGDDHRLRIWNSATGEPLERLDAYHNDWIRGIQFSPKDDLIASVGADRQLRMHSLVKPLSESYALLNQETKLVPAENCSLYSVAFHPTEPLIATAGFSDKLTIYNRETGKVSQTLSCPCTEIRSVCFSKDGRWLSAAGRNGTVGLWDELSESSHKDLPSDGRRVRALAFSPDSKQLAAAGDGPAVRVWQFDKTITSLQSGAALAGAFNPIAQEILTRPGKNHSITFVDDETLAVGGTTGEILLWNVLTRSLDESLHGHTGTVAAIASSNDGKILISGSFDATVRIWDLEPENRVAAKPATAEKH